MVTGLQMWQVAPHLLVPLDQTLGQLLGRVGLPSHWTQWWLVRRSEGGGTSKMISEAEAEAAAEAAADAEAAAAAAAAAASRGNNGAAAPGCIASRNLLLQQPFVHIHLQLLLRNSLALCLERRKLPLELRSHPLCRRLLAAAGRVASRGLAIAGTTLRLRRANRADEKGRANAGRRTAWKGSIRRERH